MRRQFFPFLLLFLKTKDEENKALSTRRARKRTKKRHCDNCTRIFQNATNEQWTTIDIMGLTQWSLKLFVVFFFFFLGFIPICKKVNNLIMIAISNQNTRKKISKMFYLLFLFSKRWTITSETHTEQNTHIRRKRTRKLPNRCERRNRMK